jgi:formylglycine-generating enzyme required for sulfatase activity
MKLRLLIIILLNLSAMDSDCAKTVFAQETVSNETTAEADESVIGPGIMPGEVRTFTRLRIPFSWCPPGSFVMGSRSEEQGRRNDENQTEVTLTQGFWMQQHEVTQGEWKAVASRAPWKEYDLSMIREGEGYPAAFISWYEAMSFCRKLTELETSENQLPEGHCFQLPTEAQWEYACRAGTTSTWNFGSDPVQLKQHAWFVENTWDVGERFAHEAGILPGNPWNLKDMHGNVWEWCYDAYSAVLPGGTDPRTDGTRRSARACRGGCWSDPPEFLRSALRGEDEPYENRYNGTGFRMILVLHESMKLPPLPTRRESVR